MVSNLNLNLGANNVEAYKMMKTAISGIHIKDIIAKRLLSILVPVIKIVTNQIGTWLLMYLKLSYVDLDFL